MVVDWWVFLVIFLVTGVWAEYRNRRGYTEGYHDAHQAAVTNTAHSIMEDKMFPASMGVFLVFKKLFDIGLLKIDKGAKTLVVGHDGKSVPIEDLTLERIKAEFFEKLNLELKDLNTK